MGTRNLTMVVADGEMKVAQYGQFDGYPSGQGRTVLDFAKKLVKKDLVKKFKKRVRQLSFYTEEELTKLEHKVKRAGGTFYREYPELHRDTAADILHHILDRPDLTKLCDSEDFAGPQKGFSCEYGYLLDLDKKVLECYVGYQKGIAPPEERFAKYNNPSGEESPIRLAVKYPFKKLPKFKKFEQDIESAWGNDEGDEE